MAAYLFDLELETSPSRRNTQIVVNREVAWVCPGKVVSVSRAGQVRALMWLWGVRSMCMTRRVGTVCWASCMSWVDGGAS